MSNTFVFLCAVRSASTCCSCGTPRLVFYRLRFNDDSPQGAADDLRLGALSVGGLPEEELLACWARGCAGWRRIMCSMLLTVKATNAFDIPKPGDELPMQRAISAFKLSISVRTRARSQWYIGIQNMSAQLSCVTFWLSYLHNTVPPGCWTKPARISSKVGCAFHGSKDLLKCTAANCIAKCSMASGRSFSVFTLAMCNTSGTKVVVSRMWFSHDGNITTLCGKRT